MGSKINTFEQHVEKFVLGIAVLGVIAVGAWEFGINESTVTFGGKKVPIATIDGELDREAQSLQSRLRDEAEPGVAFPELKRATSVLFAERLQQGSGADASIPANGPNLAAVLVKDGLSKDVTYHAPMFGAPTSLLVQSTSDAVTDEARSTFKEFLDPVLPDGVADITWVTPSALIDLEAMRTELGSSGAATPRPYPRAGGEARS